MDVGVVQNIEDGDEDSNSGSIVAGRDRRQDLVSKTLLIGNLIAFFGYGDEETFHDSGKGGRFPVCLVVQVLVYSTGGELQSSTQILALRSTLLRTCSNS